ncbi:hypothetical protein FVE88_09290, partial [Ectopseudomonas mendocina]
FLQFLLRGLEKVQNEWTLVCLAWNWKRLATLRPHSVQNALTEAESARIQEIQGNNRLKTLK